MMAKAVTEARPANAAPSHATRTYAEQPDAAQSGAEANGHAETAALLRRAAEESATLRIVERAAAAV